MAQGDAAHYPDHPIRVIVPVPAGGGVDTITRLVTGKMRDTLGQPLIVENKAGVGGSIGAENGLPFGSRRLHDPGFAARADYDQFVPLQVAQLRSRATRRRL